MASRKKWSPECYGGEWYLVPWYPTKYGESSDWTHAVGPFPTKKAALADKREKRRSFPPPCARLQRHIDRTFGAL